MDKAHVELEPTVASAQPDPFDYARSRQNVAHLKQAILALPRIQRRVLLMHRMDNMSLQEVSAELGIPLRTVQRHMMEALATCRQHLQRLGWYDAG
jgi:RNA polymerase sigma-70 factor (ECF subfamily)